MPFFVNKDGTAEFLDWKADKAEFEKRAKTGAPWFPTLAGAVIHGGVTAAAFDRAVRAEPLYDGTEALAQGSVCGLTPIGVAATYRVVALDGALLHPPRAPADLPRA